MNRVLSALKKLIVISDFKTAKTKFASQGIEKDVIDSYFKKFKEVRDQNKIKETEKKNIDTWANKPWKDFRAFVDSLETTVSKTQTKKQPWKLATPEGATKVAENSEWVIYLVEDFKASKKLGTRNWCISRDESAWYDHTEPNEDYPDEEQFIFYFALSKTKSYKETGKTESNKIKYEDPWHRLAIQVHWNDVSSYWDAEDVAYPSLKGTGVTQLPEFKNKLPEPPLLQDEEEDICEDCGIVLDPYSEDIICKRCAKDRQATYRRD